MVRGNRCAYGFSRSSKQRNDDVWLCRYPRPQFIGCDNGEEDENVNNVIEDVWLARSRSSQYAWLDNRKGTQEVFKQMVRKHYGLTTDQVPLPPMSRWNHRTWTVVTTYNPQSNGIIERVHQTLTNSLRTLELEKQDLDPLWSKVSLTLCCCLCSPLVRE